MDTVMLAGRLLVSLAAVLGVIWLIARRARRGVHGRKAKLIEVLDRAQLTRSSSVAVVRVGDRALIVGIGETQVNVLGEADLASVQVVEPADSRPIAQAEPRRGLRPRPARPARTAAPARPARQVSLPSHVPSRQITPRRPATDVPTAPATAAAEAALPTGAKGPLTGSALSPQTWRQAVETLRELTVRV